MLNVSSLTATLPLLLAGMAGVFLVIGVLVGAVYGMARLCPKNKGENAK